LRGSLRRGRETNRPERRRVFIDLLIIHRYASRSRFESYICREEGLRRLRASLIRGRDTNRPERRRVFIDLLIIHRYASRSRFKSYICREAGLRRLQGSCRRDSETGRPRTRRGGVGLYREKSRLRPNKGARTHKNETISTSIAAVVV